MLSIIAFNTWRGTSIFSEVSDRLNIFHDKVNLMCLIIWCRNLFFNSSSIYGCLSRLINTVGDI